MNSCLYSCEVMHKRLRPKSYQFKHHTFMFYLDCDEIDVLAGRLKLFGRNRWNVFNFKDSDHLDLGRKTVKANVLKFLESHGFKEPIERIMLLTHVRTLGYIFNPVSFYFCFSPQGRPVAAVAEIGNTFGELKPFLFSGSELKSDAFVQRRPKNYYISPFVDLDVEMDFNIRIPAEKLNITIDDYQSNDPLVVTSLKGDQRPLSDRQLLSLACRYPFVTLQVIGLIHWHAGVLHYLKRLPAHPKEDNPHLQTGVFRAWNKN